MSTSDSDIKIPGDKLDVISSTLQNAVAMQGQKHKTLLLELCDKAIRDIAPLTEKQIKQYSDDAGDAVRQAFNKAFDDLAPELYSKAEKELASALSKNRDLAIARYDLGLEKLLKEIRATALDFSNAFDEALEPIKKRACPGHDELWEYTQDGLDAVMSTMKAELSGYSARYLAELGPELIEICTTNLVDMREALGKPLRTNAEHPDGRPYLKSERTDIFEKIKKDVTITVNEFIESRKPVEQ